jgi:CheY-like chemotaxis protein
VRVEDSARPILVVEDDAALRDVVESALQSSGLPVELAANGVEALDRVAERVPSLIFLDMTMPILDGRGFSAEFHARGYDAPVVIMTAKENAARTAQELGAAGHLDKPFDLVDLLACVEQFRAA